MKKVVICMLLIGLLAGCGWMYEIGSSGEEANTVVDASEAGNVIEPFEFTNELGEPFGTDQLTGEYWIANFIFTNCPSVCPVMTPNMRNLQNEMIDAGIPVTFISFTVDPERDTPDILKAYGENVGADLDSWHFITGYSEEEISLFARESFKAVVQPTEDDIMHPTYFYLIDPDGLMIRTYDGYTTDQQAIISDLKETIE